MKKLLLLSIILLAVSCGSDSSNNPLEDFEDDETNKDVYKVIYTQEGNKEAFRQSLEVSGNMKDYEDGFASFDSEEKPLPDEIVLKGEETEYQISIGYLAIKKGFSSDDAELKIRIELYENGEVLEIFERTANEENLVINVNYVSPND